MKKTIPVLSIFIALAVAAMMTFAAVDSSACSGEAKTTKASSECASKMKATQASATDAGCASKAKTTKAGATCGSKTKTAKAGCTPAEKAACAAKMASTTGTANHLVLGVAYLTCNGCASQVTKALQGVNGVQSVAVDYRSGTADVEFDSDMVNSVELVNAVEKAGYHAQVGPYSDAELAKFAKGEVPAVKKTSAKSGKSCDPSKCTGKSGS